MNKIFNESLKSSTAKSDEDRLINFMFSFLSADPNFLGWWKELYLSTFVGAGIIGGIGFTGFKIGTAIEIIELLINNGAEINARDRGNKTALDHAQNNLNEPKELDQNDINEIIIYLGKEGGKLGEEVEIDIERQSYECAPEGSNYYGRITLIPLAILFVIIGVILFSPIFFFVLVISFVTFFMVGDDCDRRRFLRRQE